MRFLIILMALMVLIPFSVSSKSISCAEIDSTLKKYLEKTYPNRAKRMDDFTLLDWRYITINDYEKQGIEAGRDCPENDLIQYLVIKEILRQIDLFQANRGKRKISHHPWHDDDVELHWMIPQLNVGSHPFKLKFWKAQCKRISENAVFRAEPSFTFIRGLGKFQSITLVCMTLAKNGVPKQNSQPAPSAKEWWKSQKGKLRL